MDAQSLHEQTEHELMSYPWYGNHPDKITSAAHMAYRMAAALEAFPEREPSRGQGGNFRDPQSVALEQYVGKHGCSYADAVAAIREGA